MTRLLQGRACLVSGVGAGTGRAVALAFAREGADLVLSCRTERVAQEIAKEVEDAGARAVPVVADITQAEDRARLVAAAANAYGGIDVLVNNAFATGRAGPIESIDIAKTWRTPFEVNVFGTLLMAQAVIPSMKERGGGSIVMIGTMAARRPEAGLAGYGASKAALLSATRSFASELGRYKIRVNCVVPGAIDGAHLRVYFKNEATRLGQTEADVYQRFASRGALDHIATSDEVAAAVLFFASGMSSAITGQSLDVNCGEWFD
ncbi:MAG TPA: SDR family oxidoreductase [Polyangiaceae bacterium]|jgi:NAD(P)-dependent dehydrogenase (short-subunit alcohol dehydrogenase family)|nr:SDR family oxidoreductase [Polyangiaceae bacterium]